MADHTLKSPRTDKKLKRSKSVKDLQSRLFDLFDELLVVQQDCLAPPNGADERQTQVLREIGQALRPFERFVNVGNQGARSLIAATERVGEKNAGYGAPAPGEEQAANEKAHREAQASPQVKREQFEAERTHKAEAAENEAVARQSTPDSK